MSALKGGGSGAADKDKRVEHYLKVLNRLKERKMLREVLEREVLLEFISYNHDRINEFPLLEKQQSGIINLLCHRSVDLPAHEFIKRSLGEFILMLTRFGKIYNGKDENLIKQVKARLINAETLLIKTVQGVVYASSLISDNFEEVILSRYGEPALQKFNTLLEGFELDKFFWDALMKEFVTEEVSAALPRIVSGEEYVLARDGKNLILSFGFDHVTSRLNQSPPNFDKTRIQTSYNEVGETEESLATFKMVNNALNEGGVFIKSEGSNPDHIERIARIVCIDPATEKFHQDYVEAMERFQSSNENIAPEEEEDIARQLQFAQDQLAACAIGVSLTLDIVVREFLLALKSYTINEEKIITNLLRKFDVTSLDTLLYFLIELFFVRLLRLKIQGEEGKITLRLLKRRRSPAESVEAIKDKGMNRIRTARIWTADRESDQWMLFKHKNPKELVAEIKLLGLERELASEVINMFKNADYKIDFLLFISLTAIAKATKDIKGKLSELLLRFGIGSDSSNRAGNDALE
jgi:hypothetical protein